MILRAALAFMVALSAWPQMPVLDMPGSAEDGLGLALVQLHHSLAVSLIAAGRDIRTADNQMDVPRPQRPLHTSFIIQPK